MEKWTNLFCAIYSIPSPILDMEEVIERFGGTVAEIPGSYSLNGNIIKVEIRLYLRLQVTKLQLEKI